MVGVKKLLLNEFDFYGAEVKLEQLNLWAAELSDLPEIEIKFALEALRKDPNQTRPPFPAKIRDAIYDYPSSEEAWALLPKDESEWGVWCQPIFTAYGAIVKLLSEDTIAARMSFKSIYEKEVLELKSKKIKPRWEVTAGQDDSGKYAALKKAHAKNRISDQLALSYAPDLKIEYKKDLKLLPAPQQEEQPELTPEQIERNMKRLKKLSESLQSGMVPTLDELDEE